jgi:hypothetical protein
MGILQKVHESLNQSKPMKTKTAILTTSLTTPSNPLPQVIDNIRNMINISQAPINNSQRISHKNFNIEVLRKTIRLQFPNSSPNPPNTILTRPSTLNRQRNGPQYRMNVLECIAIPIPIAHSDLPNLNPQ